jgi:hypothetical protein
MLTNTRNVHGARLVTLDGDIGRVKDLYFDDWNWVIRYLVADANAWLPGRLVLLSPHALGKLDQYENTLHLKLSRREIAASPPLDPQRPVSRQDESAYFRHYGWPAYWEGSELWGPSAQPMTARPPRRGEPGGRGQHHHRQENHLQSAQAVLNYHIQTTDGTIGHVTGFLADIKSWAIHQVVVETGDWLAGREVLITPDKIERVSHQTSKIFARLTKADILRNEDPLFLHTGPRNPAEESSQSERPVNHLLR